jgi:hypothetical protein
VPIYKLKTFARFARDERIDDGSLVDAIKRAADGLVDADLSGGRSWEPRRQQVKE